MKYLVTGVNGQLGYDVVLELKKRGVNSDNIIALDRDSMDITDDKSVNKIFNEYKPDVVFHCAAWTNVELAEDEYDNAYKVNVMGTKNIVNACKKNNSKLIYISTDYVFDGTKEGLYETDDKTNPINAYGKTKYLGEVETLKYDKAFIVRVSWVFGINGKNFVKTMLKLSETKKELGVVCDQIGSPTYTVDLAKVLVDMSQTEKYGIYHATNSGFTSWSDFARYIFESNNIEMVVNDVKTIDYKTKSKRPLNSKLSKDSLTNNGFDLLPDWKNAVDRYNVELKNAKKLVKSKEM